MENDLDKQRRQIIDQVYDIILKPEQTNDFVSTWEQYISELSAKYDGRENATGLSDIVISDDGLETHFARAYSILERLGRSQTMAEADVAKQDAALLYRFDIGGNILDGPQDKNSGLRGVKHARDVAQHLSLDAANDWAAFLSQSLRAPSVANMRIFARQSGGNLVAFNRRDDASGDVHIILRTLSVGWTPKLRHLLTDHFRLTKRELTVVEKLAELGTLEAIAKQSTRSKNTLRAQLKTVFTKMNVTSQPAVLQSVAMLSHFCATTGYEAPETLQAPHLGDVIMVRCGDVDVPVHLLGPPDGQPVLFLHGMLDGVALNARVMKALKKYNLRFISPVRPNFGAAPPHKNITSTPEVFTPQLTEIVSQLGLTNIIMLGHMSGAVYAFAAVPALRDRIAGIVNISGGVPVLSTRQFATLSKRQKAFAYTTRYAPAVLPTLLRVGVAQIDSIEIETMMIDMYRDDSPDRVLLKDPEIASVVLDGYRFAVAQGYKGFQGDALQVTRNWSSYVNAAQKPVLLIHGHHDPAQSYQFVAAFAEREGFELSYYPDDGQLILYGKPDQVLGDVRRFIDGLITPR